MDDIVILYNNITKLLIDFNFSISTMESCTSGLIATLLTNEPGASAIFSSADVTYSNEAKLQRGVNIDSGVYSEQTAINMARASQYLNKSLIGIGVTGILGREDPNNKRNEFDVYFCIVIGDRIINEHLNIPEDIKDRFNQKLYVADRIGHSLLNALENL